MMLRSGAPALALGVAVLLGAGWSPARPADPGDRPARVLPAAELIRNAEKRTLEVYLPRNRFGHSGELRVRLTLPGESFRLPLEWRAPRPASVWYRWVPAAPTAPAAVTPRLLGAPVEARPGRPPAGSAPLGRNDGVRAPARPGVYYLELGTATSHRVLDAVSVIVLMPRDLKRSGHLNGYHIGQYPRAERDGYAPPAGFIEVTPENKHLRVSRSFRLADFLTKDQRHVWPKYLALDTLLVDKLELVLDELNAMGVRAERMVVMSGFRTPQYNRGIRQSRLSRHQFGDAADVWVDNEGNGYISDLNGDGRRDIEDARVMLRAVERVEARYPHLVGGAGVYGPRPGVRGPFVHIDVRGRRARW